MYGILKHGNSEGREIKQAIHPKLPQLNNRCYICRSVQRLFLQDSRRLLQNEYLELNVRKASLEKTHQSLLEFKEKGGKIDEYVNLENRILEIEVELQNLGVNLGDFDESNEFCTVKFALTETKKAKENTISFYHRCKVALQWAIAWFLKVLSTTFFLLLTAFIIVLLIEKRPLKRLISWVKKFVKPEDDK